MWCWKNNQLSKTNKAVLDTALSNRPQVSIFGDAIVDVLGNLLVKRFFNYIDLTVTYSKLVFQHQAIFFNMNITFISCVLYDFDTLRTNNPFLYFLYKSVVIVTYC